MTEFLNKTGKTIKCHKFSLIENFYATYSITGECPI
jgi:hypothetical protein